MVRVRRGGQILQALPNLGLSLETFGRDIQYSMVLAIKEKTFGVLKSGTCQVSGIASIMTILLHRILHVD